METTEMETVKNILLKEIGLISNRELIGDDLLKELTRAKMINEYVKSYITASVAEIQLPNVKPYRLPDKNDNDENRPVISSGKRRSLLSRL